MIGTWFGWLALPLTILISSFAGPLIGISLIVFGKNQKGQAIPFGPYLALGGACYLFFGEVIHTWYFSYLGFAS